ncbi:iron chaperone [Allokutzneria albata]|uniref:YdhG-like domain-containing protein n=1 Tax=Allokutzneria albata TaxID=211114 RepID=A0A1H0CQX7_ALLAB|nr:DUF1801 domain-containing protein [Allokutzneria albata]SDN60161.1 protein of unknown function (DU1801) [Allokutzneria albata]
MPSTVEEYLESLPEDRRGIVSELRRVILDNLPEGYEEGFQYGMIGYYIPLQRYPATYNKQALSYVALASQKNHLSLYLMGVYANPGGEVEFRDRWAATGKKLDMGKSCVRFRKLEDLPLDLIAETVAGVSVDDYIARYESSRSR